MCIHACAVYYYTEGISWYAELYRKYTAVYKHNTSVWFALQSHTGEVFVLEAHPTDPRILMSAGALCSGGCFSQKESSVTVCVYVSLAGHDGLVILWDILAGQKLKTLQLEVCSAAASKRRRVGGRL